MKIYGWIRLALLLLAPLPVLGATYYVDYTNGLDSNNGTSKSTPWKHSPGMKGTGDACSSVCASTTINAGDSIILKGCVTWPSTAFWFDFTFSGTAGNPIYIGVDQTWWDNTVSGCASAWNRPKFDMNYTSPPSGNNRIIYVGGSNYVTYDNFEITRVLGVDDPSLHQTNIFDWDSNTEHDVTVEHMYIHAWQEQLWSYGTGNISSGSCVITNYVPFSYAPSPAASWTTTSSLIRLQSTPQGPIPIGNNNPTVTVISGTNPYTITFTTNTACPSTNVNGATIGVGFSMINVMGGNAGTCTNCILDSSVIDGSDTPMALINPNIDCGLSTSNNNLCISSGVAIWRNPSIVTNNVIRYVQSAAVADCTDWHGNLIEALRFSTDPTTHTNGVECLNEHPVNNATWHYNNVERHGSVQNSNVPGGNQTVGLWDDFSPVSGSVEYIFNNVVYDNLNNNWAGFSTVGSGCCGTFEVFNNSASCGPDYSVTYPCTGNAGASCPAAFTACSLINNHFITTSTTPCGSAAGAACNTSSGNLVATTNIMQTPTQATTSPNNYVDTGTYAFLPGANTWATVGAGTNESSICTTINSINTTAGTACLSDSNYGALYNTTTHQVTIGARNSLVRPSSGAWDVGAYQFGSPIATPSVSSLTFSNQATNTTSTSQTFTITNTGGANLVFSGPWSVTGDFTATTSDCLDTIPLAVSAFCTFTVTFTPCIVGPRSGVITVYDNSGGSASSQNVSLFGTGTGTDQGTCSKGISILVH